MSVTNRQSASSHRAALDRAMRGGNPLIERILDGLALADTRQIFAHNLAFWLGERRMSGAELARRLTKRGRDTSTSAVSGWTKAKTGPDLKTIGDVADILEIPASALLQSDDDRPSPGRAAPRVNDIERALRLLAESAGFDIRVRPKRQS